MDIILHWIEHEGLVPMGRTGRATEAKDGHVAPRTVHPAEHTLERTVVGTIMIARFRWARSPLGTLTTALWGLLLLTASAAQAAPFAYIPDHSSDTVSVLDTATNTVTAKVVGIGGPFGVAVNPAGTRVYVVSDRSNALSVIDTASNTVIATALVENNASWGVAVNSAGTRVYVTHGFINGNVSVIDTASNTVIDTVVTGGTVPGVPGTALGVAVNPAGTRVYVANFYGGISVIDTATDTVVTSVAVGYAPLGVAVDPTGTRVYVVNQNYHNVSVIDTATNTVIATIPAGVSSRGVVVDPAGARVYVSNEEENTVSVIDTACNVLIGTVRVRPNSYALAVNPAGTRVYVTYFDSNDVSVIDTATNTVIATLAVDIPPSGGLTHDPGHQGVGVFMATGALPPPVDPGPPPPIRITGIEVTQGIQDLANSVPLVSGRRTFVRVYVVSDGAAVPGVTASLSAAGSYRTIGGFVTVPLEPLVPVNVGGPRITVRPLPKRSNLNDSFLFDLPWNWINFQSLRLNAELSAGPGPAKRSCLNEVLSAPIHAFETPTSLAIQFVRLGYRLPSTNALIETSLAEQRQSESWIQRAYPLSNLVSTPDFYLFDAGLGLAVARLSFLCPGINPGNLSLCAHAYVTARLAGLQFLTGFMGNADAAYGMIPQAPNDPSGSFFTRGACCTGGIGAGPSNDSDYAAHEIGHRLGRVHPVEGSAVCGHSADDSNYPYFLSFIAPPLSDPETALAGFDGGDASLLIPMSVKPPRTFRDVMGYCDPSWISDYTYKALYNSLLSLHPDIGGVKFGPGVAASSAPSAAAAQMGDWLMVFGSISPDLGTAAFMHTQRVDRIVSVPLRTPGSYSIRLIGPGGVTLADYPFAPEAVTEGEASGGASPPPLSFGHVVPFVAGTQEIQIIHAVAGDVVIGAKTISPQPPVLSNVALQGQPDPATGAATVGWTASDPDGDPLTFDVFFTRDGGASLQPLMLGLSGTSTQIDTARLGGGIAQLRVVATDGVQSASADSPPFTLANRPPRPRILTPGGGAKIYLGQLVNLEGDATDLQDGGIPDTGLTWSTQGGSLGSGARLSVTDLPVGINRVTLTATNSLGILATTSVIVTVGQAVDKPGPTLTAGPMQIGWNVGVGESQLQTAALDIGNSGSGNLEFIAHSSAPWLTLSAATGATPATITLTADPSGFAGGVTKEAEVTLTAVGIPGQVITVPVRLAVGNTFVVTTPSACAEGADSDGDGVSDACDNCLMIPNPTQFDADQDGYGNACDPDLNGDGIVNFGDLAVMKRLFFKSDRFADLNGDGVVNFADLAILKKSFFKGPGPAAGKP